MEIQTIALESRTIFWRDLGLKTNNLLELDTTLINRLGRWWDEEVDPWLSSGSIGVHNEHPKGVWFQNPRDAMLFKLRFAGTLPLDQ